MFAFGTGTEVSAAFIQSLFPSKRRKVHAKSKHLSTAKSVTKNKKKNKKLTKELKIVDFEEVDFKTPKTTKKTTKKFARVTILETQAKSSKKSI